MAKTKKKEWRDQSVQELKIHAHDLDREIFGLRNELATQRRLEKPHLIKAKRKEKARILTIISQKHHQNEAL
ncbi:MAG: 50S ribosomal protein L29 [Chlamydiales bacterium]